MLKLFFNWIQNIKLKSKSKMVVFFIAHLKNTTRRTAHLNLKFFGKSRFFDDFFRNFENPRKLGTYSKIERHRPPQTRGL